MDADSGSLCCMSQVSESGNVVLFGDTNGGVHSWSTESSASQHPDAGNGSKQGVGPLNAMVWEPEPRPEPTKVGHRSEILLELSGGNGGAGLSFQQQQQKRLERPPLVPPRCTSPGSALAFLQHLQLSEFPQCLSDSMLEAAKRELLPRSGLPIVRIRPDLLNAQQVSACAAPVVGEVASATTLSGSKVAPQCHLCALVCAPIARASC